MTMIPERKAELIALREVRDELSVHFNKARDDWTQACSDLNYALLEELDYYHHITQKKERPGWYDEVMAIQPSKEVITRRKADVLVEQMMKQAHEKLKKEENDDSSGKPVWG
jgi:hypothetical protein